MIGFMEANRVLMRFANGYAVSITACPGSYSELRGTTPSGAEEYDNLEVAVLAPNGSRISGSEYPHGNALDDVSGWKSADELADIIHWAKSQ